MALEGRSDLWTHKVTNQPLAAGDRDLWCDDPLLRQLASGGDAQADRLAGYGLTLGRRTMRDAAQNAERHPPELLQFDTGGRRLDEVSYHPAYHLFMKTSIAAGYHAVAWESGRGGHLTHACMVYLASQVEPGHCCPLTMTYAAAAVLRNAAQFQDWRASLLSRLYDPSVRPLSQKLGATLGMAMTEKQGGSDVRSNTTQAEPDAGLWRLTGHKWFCSAPMSDGFLTLARTVDGLTCFLVPRWLEDERNGIRIQRLKDKLGNRANASAEIEYQDALAHQVGEVGDGVRTIVEMVHHTRLDTSMAPAGLMRAALREAHRWTSQRTAFQRRLIDQPLMRAVLADITLDWIGALALGLHVARAFDSDSAEDRAFSRIGVALAKYSANKLCPTVVCEAMEALGGMGYVEDSLLPMLYREAPLNGIWEGSANVICLDALRTFRKAPLSAAVLLQELTAARGLHALYDKALEDHLARWREPAPEAEARLFTHRSALLLTCSVLLRSACNPALADVFVQTRLSHAQAGRTGVVDETSARLVLDESFSD